MSNSDSNFTHFLCIFVGHKCAKVKKIPKRVACDSFAPERYASAFISYKTKNTAFTVKDGVQITNGCSIY